MDLKKILGGIEGHEDLIKQINAEIGKEFVPRGEFNTKNKEANDLQAQLDAANENLKTLETEKAAHETTVAGLNQKITGYEAAALKTKIAYELGLPHELAGRLSGDDEAAIRTDAETLQGLLGGKQAPPLKDTEDPLPSGEDAAYKTLLSDLKGE